MDFRPMSPDEIERTKQLLQQSQAQFDARMDGLTLKTTLLADKLNALTAKVDRLLDGGLPHPDQ